MMIGAMAAVDLDQGRIQGMTTVTQYRRRRMVGGNDGARRIRRGREASLHTRSIGGMIEAVPIAVVGGGLGLDLVPDLEVEAGAGADPGTKIGGGGASRTKRGIGDGMMTMTNEIGSKAANEEGVAVEATATRTGPGAMVKTNLAASKRPRPS